MAKNDFLKRLQARQQRDISYHRKFTMQWCADAAVLAANEVFQRKGKKLDEFFQVYMRYAQEIAEMTMEDAQGDKSLEYTKAKIDGRLEELLGEDFVPWEERYDI